MQDERKMRAKVQVGSIVKFPNAEGEVSQEQDTFFGVSRRDGYPADGSDENNTFAKFSPSVMMNMTIANPALVGSFEIGNTFYVDFSPAPK